MVDPTPVDTFDLTRLWHPSREDGDGGHGRNDNDTFCGDGTIGPFYAMGAVDGGYRLSQSI